MILQELVGKRIVEARLVKVVGCDDWIELDFGGGYARLVPEGDCCARAYIQHVTNAWTLQGALVTSVESSVSAIVEGSPDKGDVTDGWCVTVDTDRGTCTIEMRVEHNGYYSGTLTYEDSVEPSGGELLVDDF